MSGKILGFLSNDDSLTATAITQASQEVNWSEQAWGGVGVSWLQEGRVLERKNPRVTGGVIDALGLLAELPSRAMLGHATEQILGASNTMQPHRFRKMVYIEHGLEDVVDEHLSALVDRMPDFLRRNVDASSASHVRFFYLLDALFHADVFHAASHRRTRAAEVAASALAAMQGELDVRFEGYAGMLMTERVLIAMACGAPLYYRVWEGISEYVEDVFSSGVRQRAIEHKHYRGVLVASAEEPLGGAWRVLEPGMMLWVDDGWEVRVGELP